MPLQLAWRASSSFFECGIRMCNAGGLQDRHQGFLHSSSYIQPACLRHHLHELGGHIDAGSPFRWPASLNALLAGDLSTPAGPFLLM